MCSNRTKHLRIDMALIPLLGIAAENNNFSTTTLPRSIYVDVSNGERTEIIPLKTESRFTFRMNVDKEDLIENINVEYELEEESALSDYCFGTVKIGTLVFVTSDFENISCVAFLKPKIAENRN